MNGSDEEKVHRTVERVARESYGRLVAYLSVHTQDLAGAEDALSEALLKALTVWPRDGVPQNPEGLVAHDSAQLDHRFLPSSTSSVRQRT